MPVVTNVSPVAYWPLSSALSWFLRIWIAAVALNFSGWNSTSETNVEKSSLRSSARLLLRNSQTTTNSKISRSQRRKVLWVWRTRRSFRLAPPETAVTRPSSRENLEKYCLQKGERQTLVFASRSSTADRPRRTNFERSTFKVQRSTFNLARRARR